MVFQIEQTNSPVTASAPRGFVIVSRSRSKESGRPSNSVIMPLVSGNSDTSSSQTHYQYQEDHMIEQSYGITNMLGPSSNAELEARAVAVDREERAGERVEEKKEGTPPRARVIINLKRGQLSSSGA